MFNAKEAKDQCVQWIRDWFNKNGPDCNAIIGISGGKDSTVAAALCVEALGKDRVFGVLMPNGKQSDIQDAFDIAAFLGIGFKVVDIKDTIEVLKQSIFFYDTDKISNQTEINLPARIRMCTLYAISQSMNGRVVNTCNKSEDWIGYSTKYGDAAGDFAPLANLLVREVKAIGHELGLPEYLIEKTPSDGLCGKTDEDNLGFTYATLDAYVGDGIEPESEIKEKIDRLHKQNLFKLLPMESFVYKSAA